MGLLETGQTLGKYRLVRAIGTGGMGAVYLAEDTTLGRQVALKVLHRALLADSSFERRFRQEARTIAGLDHPSIIKIHAFDKIEDDLVIEMAYVDGGSLEDGEQAGALTTRQVLRCVRDVLTALASCHAVGIVHRDVKPSNILLTRDGRALLSDFGLAQLMSEQQAASVAGRSSSTLFMGTPRYAAPESWDGLQPTPAWDVYSVGMVLYEALGSRLPYDAETPLALVKQIAERTVSPLSEIAPHASPELSDLVEAMMARDPDQRLKNATEVLDRLDATPELQGMPNVKTPTVVIQRPRPESLPSSRNKRRLSSLQKAVFWGVGFAVVLFVALALGGVFLWTQSRDLNVDAQVAPALIGESDSPPALSAKAPAYLMFDTVDATTHAVWANHWLMYPADRPGEWDVLASASTHLWFLRLALGKDTPFVLRGTWAEYADATARYFSHGTLQGTGVWLELNKAMAVTIEFRSTQDGSRWSRSYTLKPPEQPVTNVDFVRRLESADCIQPFLYNELLAREIPWAESVERQFVAPVASMLEVPRKEADEAETLKMDGRLDDPLWKPVIIGKDLDVGKLRGWPEDSKVELLVRYVRLKQSGALLIALRGPRRYSRLQASIALLNRFSVPATQSPRWYARLEDDAIVECRHEQKGQTVPWECHWQMKTGETGDGWEAEIQIPFSDFGEGVAFSPKDRCRMNCVISDAGAPDSAPIARWGFVDLNQVEHGVILVPLL